MADVIALVPTTSGSRYLQQLCKHWSHKLEVEFTPEHGDIAFPNGARATLDAKADALEVRLHVDEEDNLDRMKQVVQSHLDRFAFREAPLPFNWRAA